jgi:type II secretory pathway pseudopilin PulG
MNVFIRNQSGMSLTEVMIAGAIAGALGLTIAQTTQYSSKSLKSIGVRQAASDFKAQISSLIESKTQCKTLITTTLNPSLTTPQPISLMTPSGSFRSGSYVGDSLKISTLSFKKLTDANTGGSFDMNGVTLWPLTGTLDITLENLAAQNGLASGTKQFSFSFPMSLTLQMSGAWTVKSCLAETPIANTHSGWNSGVQINSDHCQTITVGSGQKASCPEGMYIVKQSLNSNMSSTRSPYTVEKFEHQWFPNCLCEPDGEGRVCVAGSKCRSQCDADGNVSIRHKGDNCKGTCRPYMWCAHQGDKVTTGTEYQDVPSTTYNLNVTCCKVQK